MVPAWAQTIRGPALSGLTLDDAVARALTRNPDLVAARLRVDSAHAERKIAGAIPNPLLSVTPSNPTQYSAQLPLDVTVARHYRMKATSQGESVAHLDVLDAERQLRYAVRQAYYDVLLADSLRALAADQAYTFRRLLEADSLRLRSGSVAERDVVTARLQLAHSEAVLARATTQQHAMRLSLEMLMGEPHPDTSLLISGALAYQPLGVITDAVFALAFTYRPDLQSSSVRVNQSTSALALARAALIPVPVVGAVYQPSQPFNSGERVAPSVGLTIPLFYLFSGERERARASVEAARVNATRTRLQIHSDVTLAVDAYLSAKEVADRYACGLLADASGALEGARYAYDRGATGLPDLLEAIRSYADTRSDYLTAVHDYWVSLFALERAAGTDFVRARQ